MLGGNHEILEIDNLKYTLITSPYEGKLLYLKMKKIYLHYLINKRVMSCRFQMEKF